MDPTIILSAVCFSAGLLLIGFGCGIAWSRDKAAGQGQSPKHQHTWGKWEAFDAVRHSIFGDHDITMQVRRCEDCGVRESKPVAS